ncbi:amino acid adenylation domain-containing protein [Paraburkholderia sp. GAS41]|uniref:non-ribosomal peptide synthetase n=1 Tax=Paraburkholderia sp. GAS41 TaxID=3035134 RepID=UPI003D1F921E
MEQIHRSHFGSDDVLTNDGSDLAEADTLTLSSSQERLWFLDQWHPGQALYNVPYALRFDGRVDGDALEAAFERVLHRHEVLRTRFPVHAGGPVQEIRSASESIHWVVSSDELDEAKLQQRMAAEAKTPFDLEHGPLLRALLLRADSDQPVLVVTLHHIVTDGLSMQILWRDLAELYAAARGSREAALPALPIQYADYAVWQRAWLAQADSLREYWVKQLAGFGGVLDLPTDRPRPPVQSMHGASLSHAIPPKLRDAVHVLALNEGVTPFMALLAVFQALLQRYCGSDDIVVGIPVANRPHVDLEQLVGLFVNTLAIRTNLGGQPTVTQLLARVRDTTLGAFAHAELPFDHVVDAVRPERSMSYMPLCQVMLSMLDTDSNCHQFDGTRCNIAELDIASAKFDLSVSFVDSPDGLTLLATYSTDLFDADTIRRLLANFETLLQGFVNHPRQIPVPTLDLVSEAERLLVLDAFNDTRTSYPRDTLVHQLFEDQAARHPTAVALAYDSQSLDYGHLNRRANQLAHALIARGVRPNDRVALCVDRSFDMVIGVLGILKAGGAYVPLDPSYPTQRLSYMIDDCAPVAVLTRSNVSTALPPVAVPLIALDRAHDAAHIASFPDTNPAPNTLGLTPSHLAYVIYTSGSTGMPKGVMGHHRGMCNLASAQAVQFGVSAESRILQFASLSFDVSISEYLMALCAGGSLRLAQKERLYPGEPLLSTIAAHAPTHISLPPSALAALPEHSFSDEVAIIVAGEICPAPLAAQWSATHTMFNAYGPTETTVYATVHACRPDSTRSVPIGRPIANTQIYILDAHGLPSPISVTGEIYIAGTGVAYGYLNREELTRERFVTNHFAADPSARMYRTGDLGRWLPDGTVECLGRNDFQVKLRGFRIELGEIEDHLCAHEGVREAVVVAREDKRGNKRLVAYWVAGGAGQMPDIVKLRKHLARRLPDYMVPGALVQLKRMPLTGNGKIDRPALPEPDDDAYASGKYRAPRGELEEGFAKLWADLLQINRVGVEDNFFDLGGHSMLALQMRAALQKEYGIDISIVDLFGNATIRSLIAHVEGSANRTPSLSAEVRRAGLARQYFAQQSQTKRQS